MKKYTVPFILCLLAFPAIQLSAQQKRTVDFTGGARSVMSNNLMDVHDSINDTTTVKRNTGGYALIDLGVNIRPNKHTEILGMFRIRNNYGGFWGSGVSFDVRQLWLKGIIGNVVRYQIGDLNLKQTPFTLYNHHADRIDSLPAVFGLQNQIVSYEKFYRGNTWRQQGINADFGLNFARYIREIDFNAYLTRLLATNFSNTPDRLMGGFSATIIRSKNLSLSYHHFAVFDVIGTATDSNTYRNNVNTFGFAYSRDINNNKLEIKAETGKSLSAYAEQTEASLMKDKFLHATASFLLVKQHLSFTAGYLNVGPDFRSIGAQSKDISYSSTPEYYNRYTNKQIMRPLNLFDVIRNDNIYNTGVTFSLMNPNPLYNNVLPYGIATFNRQGMLAAVQYTSPKGISAVVNQYLLSEIRGQGTYQLKQFSQTSLSTRFDINTLAGFKKAFSFQFGVKLQSAKRTSDSELANVDFKNTQLQAGVEYEIFPRIDLLLGTISLATKGNDFITERDAYGKATYFTNIDYDLKQQLSALGCRFRFGEKTYLTAIYQSNNYSDKLKDNPDYRIDQFSLIFNMTF